MKARHKDRERSVGRGPAAAPLFYGAIADLQRCFVGEAWLRLTAPRSARPADHLRFRQRT